MKLAFTYNISLVRWEIFPLELQAPNINFPKTINQWEFDYGLFTNLPRIIVACDFYPISFNLKRVILPLLSYQAEIFPVN